MFPRVSIVISVKNEEKYIADLLNSIVNLDYPKDKLETIVVDGGSTDKTLEFIAQYPVKLITCCNNLSEGKNVGVRKATGEIIAIVDGDCIVDKDWIKNIVKHFQERSEIGAVGGPYLHSNQKEIYARYRAAWAEVFFPRKTGFITRAIALGGGNIAYRREIFEKIGFFNEHLGRGATIGSGEDLDFNLRLMNAGYKLFYAEDVKVFHRFRTSFQEASKINFRQGMDSSLYSRKCNHMSKTRKFYNLSVPFLFPMFGFFLIASLLSKTFLATYIMLILALCYYIYKLGRFYVRVRTKMSWKMRIAVPVIDIYVMLLWSLGAIIGLVSSIWEKKPNKTE